MRYILSILIALGILLAPFNAADAKKPVRKQNNGKVIKKRQIDNLARLQKWMTGYFSSQQQAAKDSDFFDVRLRVTPIWAKRTDGYWLYAEQALAEHQQRPYRQRVYHLTQLNDTTFENAVYAFSEPARFAGEWQKAEPLASLIPDSLLWRQGCSIIFHKHGEIAFVGGTIDTNCGSEVKGAAYNTSEFTISKDQILNWDRGFDREGNQVWGTRKGGYVFKRVDDAPKPDSLIK